MIEKLNKLRILSFVGCVVIVLPVLLCGCESKADRDAATYLKLGNVDFEAGRYKEAIASYQKAIVTKPDYADAYSRMADAYEQRKEYSEAIATLEKYIAIEPTGEMADNVPQRISDLSKEDRARALYGQGLDHAIADRYVDALAAYKKAIAIKPDYAEVYSGMSNVYSSLKQYDNAIAAHKKAIDIKPDAKGYYFMAATYGYAGKYTEAIATLKKCIAVEPTGRWVTLAREEISRLSRK